MRIIGGTCRGVRLRAPEGEGTRPTSDRARQALFDSLAHAPWSEGLADRVVLDAFAGTGALALEALSRGAARAVLFETNARARAAIAANVAACRMEARVIVRTADVTRPPKGEGCDLVFLDPPYGLGLVPRALSALRAGGWLAPGALIVAEQGVEEEAPVAELLLERAHGAAILRIWRLEADPT